MPKVNVNVATREDLVERAGLRPAVADAILEFRGKHGGRITDVEALDELPGVGPATLDELRSALDFRDKGEKAGNSNGSDKAPEEGEKAAGAVFAARSGARAARDAVETGAQAASTARSGAEAARGMAEAGARATSTAARDGLRLVERTAGAMGEVQRETARRSAEGTAELGRLFAELVAEQARHNLEVATAFGRAVDWGQVLQVQGEFVRASLERMSRLNGRYLEMVQGVVQATASAAEQARKAA